MRVNMRTEPRAELIRERLQGAAGALRAWLRRLDNRRALDTPSRTLSGRPEPSLRPAHALLADVAERDRLQKAGLLAVVPAARHPRPTDGDVSRARREAGQGRSLTDYVVEGRD
jgi:hypothetical protein